MKNFLEFKNIDNFFTQINGSNRQQWKLVLEQYPVGYIWPPELVNQSDDLVQSKSHRWRMGVDVLISLMQKLVEKKNSKKDYASDTTSETSSVVSDSSNTGPELLPQFCDTFFSTQFVGDRHLFSAFYKPENVLTVSPILIFYLSRMIYYF